VCVCVCVCVCASEIMYCKVNPCQNEGVCREGLTGYTCDCCPAYTGRDCGQTAAFHTEDVEICDSTNETCYYTRGEVR